MCRWTYKRQGGASVHSRRKRDGLKKNARGQAAQPLGKDANTSFVGDRRPPMLQKVSKQKVSFDEGREEADSPLTKWMRVIVFERVCQGQRECSKAQEGRERGAPDTSTPTS